MMNEVGIRAIVLKEMAKLRDFVTPNTDNEEFRMLLISVFGVRVRE
jgi:hypothetical protein